MARGAQKTTCLKQKYTHDNKCKSLFVQLQYIESELKWISKR